jgi:hypothetical protein
VRTRAGASSRRKLRSLSAAGRRPGRGGAVGSLLRGNENDQAEQDGAGPDCQGGRVAPEIRRGPADNRSDEPGQAAGGVQGTLGISLLAARDQLPSEARGRHTQERPRT